jgi:2-methylcitrate dehydratase PrpD
MGAAIEELARFIAGTPWEAIPTSVREHAKLVVLDTVGVILGGSVQPEVAGVRARLTATGGPRRLCAGSADGEPTSPSFHSRVRGKSWLREASGA